MSSKLSTKSDTSDTSDYDIINGSEASDSASIDISTTEDYETITHSVDYEFICDLPYREKCTECWFVSKGCEIEQRCSAIRFKKCRHSIRHDCRRFWPLKKPYTCPYMSHFLVDRAESVEEKVLARICRSARFRWFETLCLHGTVESWAANNDI